MKLDLQYLSSEGSRREGINAPVVAADVGLWASEGYQAYEGSLTPLFQDTVVALQALSRYGAATFTRTGKPTQVTIQHSGTVVAKFQVDDDNRLLLQQTSLPELPKEYTMTVTGEGCVYLQVRLLVRISH